MAIDNLYNITVDIQRPTMSQDDYGAQVKTWTDLFKNVKGRLQRKGAREVIFADKDTVWSDYTFYCSPMIAISNKDRIEYDGRYFMVRGTDNANQMNHHQKVDLLEIK